MPGNQEKRDPYQRDCYDKGGQIPDRTWLSGGYGRPHKTPCNGEPHERSRRPNQEEFVGRGYLAHPKNSSDHTHDHVESEINQGKLVRKERKGG